MIKEKYFFFDDFIEETLIKEIYSWKRFTYLISLFFYAEKLLISEAVEGIKFGPVFDNILAPYKEYNQLVSNVAGHIQLLGYMKKWEENGILSNIYCRKGIIVDRNTFFTLDTRIEVFGIARYAFELGLRDKNVAEIQSKLTFEGPEESNSNVPLVHLEVREKPSDSNLSDDLLEWDG